MFSFTPESHFPQVPNLVDKVFVSAFIISLYHKLRCVANLYVTQECSLVDEILVWLMMPDMMEGRQAPHMGMGLGLRNDSKHSPFILFTGKI